MGYLIAYQIVKYFTEATIIILEMRLLILFVGHLSLRQQPAQEDHIARSRIKVSLLHPVQAFVSPLSRRRRFASSATKYRMERRHNIELSGLISAN